MKKESFTVKKILLPSLLNNNEITISTEKGLELAFKAFSEMKFNNFSADELCCLYKWHSVVIRNYKIKYRKDENDNLIYNH